ncbi:NXPE family member 3-like isoform X2 [Rhineura floridana]|nr:NXPE family member 3-like isoform X2 [Rhineura floridana]
MTYRFLFVDHPRGKLMPPSPVGAKPGLTPFPESLGPELSALHPLLDWPAPADNTVAFASSTSPEKSRYWLLQSQSSYTVGNTLLVWLEAWDHSGQPKHYGGDFFRAKLHSPELKASVAGTVQDHNNGTYMLAFPLLWAGAVQVSVHLIHSSETVALLRHIRNSHPSTVAFYGYFMDSGLQSKEEVTECNVHPFSGPTCQYVDPGTNESWFCARPHHLSCSDLVHHSAGIYKNVLTPNEKNFFSRAVTDRAIPGSVPIIQVLPSPQSAAVTSPPLPCRPGLALASPSGFYYKDVWVSLGCSSRTFPTPDMALSCLRGKTVHMIGDSTLRQWWEFLLAFIPSVKRMDLHVTYQSGPLLAVEPAEGLVLRWRAHGLPLRTQKTKLADIHYLANELDALGGGPDMVVAFTIWAHFSTFPVEVYVQQLHSIRQAVAKLLARSPLTTIVIKTANTGYKSVYGSDWLSMQLDIILRAMFNGMRVAFVDAWAMTSCHYLPDNIHPGKVIVQNEVNSFLSYVCPGK